MVAVEACADTQLASEVARGDSNVASGEYLFEIDGTLGRAKPFMTLL